MVSQTRLDSAYAYSKLAQFNANPPDEAMEGINHLYRYLLGTDDLGILFHTDGNKELVGYTDSNHGDKYSSDMKSTSAYSFSLAGAPIL